MKTPRMTKARKQEYRVILLRDQLDPKRRYKRMPNKIPKVFQVRMISLLPPANSEAHLSRCNV